MEVVAEAADGAEVAALVAEHSPDIVLMDIRMPGMDGLVTTKALRARPSPDSPGSSVQRMSHPSEVLVLTTFSTDEHVLRALRAGAAGFVLEGHSIPGDRGGGAEGGARRLISALAD